MEDLHSSVRAEAAALMAVAPHLARRKLTDRIGRSFQLDGEAFGLALDFNAQLVTELRRRGFFRSEHTLGAS